MNIKAPENVTVIDGYSLASPFERIIAFVLDLIIYSILLALLFLTMDQVGIGWLAGIISGLYLILRDSIPFLNQSLGKKIMKLKVIHNNDSTRISLLDAFKRNFIFLPNMFYAFEDFHFALAIITLIFFVVELYLLYSSTDHQRLGDQFADTIVIENYS